MSKEQDPMLAEGDGTEAVSADAVANVVGAVTAEEAMVAAAENAAGEGDGEAESADISPTEEEIAWYTKMLEAVLLVSGEAIPVSQLCKLFDPPLPVNFVRHLLTDLKEAWKNRMVELVTVAGGWRFQGKPEVQRSLERLSPERPPRYSRAAMETLAIIAYRQPVTRGDIEAIRGVAVSSGVIKALEDRQWVEAVGHRETPGRPALYATTKNFLNDLGLCSLAELPPLAELDSSHLLEMPDAPAKAAEAPLALASPILSQPVENSPIESGDAGFCGNPADQDQENY
ncbi:MAG: SMC-Scp complex subunit ScpB [Burkholderiales bacterium]|jgi:segregation and condensation protein B|nr:SMC-Scp complex subunit ScpB [Burkholderiales bacterium]